MPVRPCSHGCGTTGVHGMRDLSFCEAGGSPHACLAGIDHGAGIISPHRRVSATKEEGTAPMGVEIEGIEGIEGIHAIAGEGSDRTAVSGIATGIATGVAMTETLVTGVAMIATGVAMTEGGGHIMRRRSGTTACALRICARRRRSRT